MNAIVNEYSLKAMEKYQDKTVKVLVEGTSKKNDEVLAGYTERGKLVNFEGPKSAIGEIVEVKITNTKTWSLDGTMVEKAASEQVEVI